jgi:protein-S-isoprenylcysteine O-methyltransferase Ste14
VAFHFFVLIYEEPILRGSYGHEYQEFCKHVPRWIPGVRPWKPTNK